MTASPAFPAHAIHASMPACTSSGLEFAIMSEADICELYRTRNLAIGRSFLRAGGLGRTCVRTDHGASTVSNRGRNRPVESARGRVGSRGDGCHLERGDGAAGAGGRPG